MARSRRLRLEGYLRSLFVYAYSLSQSREDAADLVQDCALRALSARHAPDDEAAYRAWLFRVVRHLHIDSRRRATREVRRDRAASLGREEANLRLRDESIVNAITVQRGLEKLKPAQREVIALVDMAGFSYEEAAAVLDVPAGTLMSRLHRARRCLLAIVSQDNVYVLEPHRNRRPG